MAVLTECYFRYCICSASLYPPTVVDWVSRRRRIGCWWRAKGGVVVR